MWHSQQRGACKAVQLLTSSGGKRLHEALGLRMIELQLGSAAGSFTSRDEPLQHCREWRGAPTLLHYDS